MRQQPILAKSRVEFGNLAYLVVKLLNRADAETIDWHSEHRADRCPDCGGRLNRCEETRTRYTEDIPDIKPEVWKNSYGNRSEQGADAQSVFMSIFRTLKQRGHDPIRTIIDAIVTFLETGKLPPLPAPKSTSDR